MPQPAVPRMLDPLTARVPDRASEILREALASRLTSVARALLPLDEAQSLAARGAGVLADVLVRRVYTNRRDDELWLLLVGITAAFPDSEFLLRARRALAVVEPELALSALLEMLHRSPDRLESLEHEIDIESTSMVADVDFCARFDHNTGIQRVVRETMSRWNGVHDVRLACWSAGDRVFRDLLPLERRRVVEWDSYKAEVKRPAPSKRAAAVAAAAAAAAEARATARRPAERFVVPFRTTVLLPEVAHEGLWPRLAALARFSGNCVAMIGYDTIPIGSAAVIEGNESEKFAKYLTIVKNATRIAAISQSAADEFSGFVSALAAQGVTGPHVGCVTLAVESPAAGRVSGGAATAVSTPAAATPLVLIVGNQEPRKNLLAVLFAAETLWREGLAFRLRMIGGGRPDYTPLIDREAKRLTAAGYPIEVLRGVGDDVLVASYRDAYVTLFPSTHEGYGLPVAESLAMGVPSITSNYGSTQQIADGGGCLTVDPRDDESIIRGLRLLLTDPAERERLAAEARARTSRRWNDYALELWHELAEPLETTT